jgi:hypothetical protein
MKLTHTLSALCLLLALALPPSAAAKPPDTVVNDAAAMRRLLGRHAFSLQWVSWDRFGRVVVSKVDKTLYIKGEQRDASTGDYVRIDGVVTSVDSKEFGFRGKIVTRVSHINGGEPCTRDGDFTFAIKANRQYWRLQQMDNPCEPVTDYVDVYFRRG